MKDELKKIGDEISHISIAMVILVGVTMCSRTDLSTTNHKLERISTQLERIADKCVEGKYGKEEEK